MHKLTAALLGAYNTVIDAATRLDARLSYRLEEWHAAALARAGTLATRAADLAEAELDALEQHAKHLLNAAEYVFERAEEKERAALEWVRNELAKIGR